MRSLSFDGNIVQFYGACLQKDTIMMVLEFMGVRQYLVSLLSAATPPWNRAYVS